MLPSRFSDASGSYFTSVYSDVRDIHDAVSLFSSFIKVDTTFINLKVYFTIDNDLINFSAMTKYSYKYSTIIQPQKVESLDVDASSVH